MRRFLLSLRSPVVFILVYWLSTDLRASTLHDLPDDLLRACTVAVFYFLTTYVLKRRSHKERGV